MSRLLVTGGTGFVGSHVVSALSWRQGPATRVLTRRSWHGRDDVEPAVGDLAEPSSIRGICDGVDTVLHLASHVGDDAQQCRLSNDEGTRNLLAEARRAGCARVVHLSTCAVYGRGEHVDATEQDLAPLPCSTVSSTRLAAENHVRDYGGIVLRPNLIHGPGDVWFLPTLVKLLNAVPAWADGGSARISLISVEDLAAVCIALATRPWRGRMPRTYHVNDPTPTSLREVIEALCARLDLPPPVASLRFDEYRELVRVSAPRLTDHQVELVGKDHFYRSTRIWRDLGISPGPGFAQRFGSAAPWYREYLERAAPPLTSSGC